MSGSKAVHFGMTTFLPNVSYSIWHKSISADKFSWSVCDYVRKHLSEVSEAKLYQQDVLIKSFRTRAVTLQFTSTVMFTRLRMRKIKKARKAMLQKSIALVLMQGIKTTMQGIRLERLPGILIKHFCFHFISPLPRQDCSLQLRGS